MSSNFALTPTYGGNANSTRIGQRSAQPLATCVGLYFSIRLVFVLVAGRLFSRDPQDGVVASFVCNYLLLGLVAFDAVGPAPIAPRPMLRLPCLRWVMIFIGFSGLSLLWSVTASLPAALAFWFAMAADTVIVMLLLCSGPVDSVVNSLMQGYIWGGCAIALLAWMLPAQSDLRLGDEGYLGPNQIGWVCAFAFFLAQYLMRTKTGNWSAHAVLLAVTLLRSLSKTTIIAFVAGQAYILLRDRSMSRSKKVLLTLAALFVVIAFSGLITSYFDLYTNAGTQSETLTGRFGIWAYFAEESFEKPWIGHGFHSVWKVVPPFYDGFEARHAHNEFLQQFYAYGAVGILILIATYIAVYRQIRRLRHSSLKTFFTGMLLFILVRGLADTEPFDLSLPMWFIVMIGALVDQSRRDREVTA